MPGSLIIESKAFPRVADLHQSAGVRDPFHNRSRQARGERIVEVRWMQRVGPEGMLDICGQQFQVLLLMVYSQHQALLGLEWRSRKERFHGGFDVLAVLKHFL